MDKKVYLCSQCYHLFLYNKTEAAENLCRNCLTNSLQEFTRFAIFCPTCRKQYDAQTVINSANNVKTDTIPDVNLGMLVCPKDKNALITHGMLADINNITNNILQRFYQEKVDAQNDEARFMQKLKSIRTDDDKVKASASTSESSTNVSSTSSIKKQKVNVQIPETKTSVEPVGIPIIKESKSPIIEEFWEFYRNPAKLLLPDEYLGGVNATEKIRDLLNEFNNKFLKNQASDLSQPIIETLKNGKIFYIGDTHGSIVDTDKCITFFIKEIEQARSSNSEILIIFDGDYVDRNVYDIHNILYIFTFALKFPNNVRLLRGNHEDVTISMNYGFWEHINTYLPNSYLFNDFGYIFMKLPLIHVASTPNNKIMCLHGGVPFYGDSYENFPDIPNIMDGSNPIDSVHSNLDEMCILSQQILWSDPADNLPEGVYFLPSPRGAGYTFGKPIFDKFCEVNKIDRLIRGHEVYLEGHKEYFENRLFSLFSCSNYGKREIQAKILEFDLSKPWENNWKHIDIRTEI